MSKFQLAYWEKRMDRATVNDLWFNGHITSEQRRAITAEFDKVDDLRRLVAQAQNAAKLSEVKHTPSACGFQNFMDQERDRLFQKQCRRNAGIF